MFDQPQARKEIEAALIAKAQAEPAFRQALLTDPRAAVERELGYQLPAGLDLRVLEETSSARYLVLPTVAGSELSDAELGSVSGGVRMAQAATYNKSKVADKAADAVDAYIRS